MAGPTAKQVEERLARSLSNVEDGEKGLADGTHKNIPGTRRWLADDLLLAGLCLARLGRGQEARQSFRRSTSYWFACLYDTDPSLREDYLHEDEALTAALLSGDPDLARRMAEHVRGEQVRVEYGEGLSALALKHAILGNLEEARRYATEMRDTAEEDREPRWEAQGEVTLAVINGSAEGLRHWMPEFISRYNRSKWVRGTVPAWVCLPGLALLRLSDLLGRPLAVEHRLLPRCMLAN